MKHFLNRIIETKGYQSYLEIGVDNPDNNFNGIVCAKKVGVDPYDDGTGCHLWNGTNKDHYIANIDPNATFHQCTSDEYFGKKGRKPKFDLIYIDGLHIEEHVDKDINNALQCLNDGGMIVLDDVPPANEYEEKTPPDFGQPWRGTVWRSYAKLRLKRTDLTLYCIPDIFKAVIIPNGVNVPYTNKDWPTFSLSFQFMSAYRDELLNCITEDQFYETL